MLVQRSVEGKGQGVFTTEALDAWETLMFFTGPIIKWKDLEGSQYDPEHVVQVSADSFMGPSGNLDDTVNHSCSPNCALLLDPPRLVTLRAIEPDEELTFDYSITSTETPEEWSMKCCCGSPSCRGIISGFATVPRTRQVTYFLLGLVPFYQSRG